jgi:hypothetical protein
VSLDPEKEVEAQIQRMMGRRRRRRRRRRAQIQWRRRRAQIQKGSTYLTGSHRRRASLRCHGDHRSEGREAEKEGGAACRKASAIALSVAWRSQEQGVREGEREHRQVGEVTLTARRPS